MVNNDFPKIKTEVKFRAAHDIFFSLMGEYEIANPEFFKVTLMQIFYEALDALKDSIEDPDIEGVSWDYPFVTIAYPLVDVKIKEDGSIDMMKVRLTPEDVYPEISPEKVIENLYEWKRFHVFELMTHNIVEAKMGDKFGCRLPQYLQDAVDKLPENERQSAIEDITTMPVIDDLKINYEAKDKKGKTHKGQGTISFQINPLFIDTDKPEAQEGFYPVNIGIEFKGFKPSKWDDEFKEQFWKTILDSVKNMIPEEHWDFLDVEEDSAQKPEVRVELQRLLPPVKAAVIFEKQRFAPTDNKNRQLTFDDYIRDQEEREKIREKVEITGINIPIGVDITGPKSQAVHAIQKMLTDTNYKGNLDGVPMVSDGTGFKFTGKLPALEFTKSEYFDAYGVCKVVTERGTLEYSGYEREEAIRALLSLATDFHLITYKRERWEDIDIGNKGRKKRERRTEIIEKPSPLIEIMWRWKDLTDEEVKTVSKRENTPGTERKYTMAIIPSPVMVDGIDNYFVLKPAELYKEIKAKFPNCSKFVETFINWLIVTAEEKARRRDSTTIKINYEKLGRKLRMDSYINSRNRKGLRNALIKCYDIAVNLEYLNSYKIDVQGKTIECYDEFVLNLEKFKRLKERQPKIEEPSIP